MYQGVDAILKPLVGKRATIYPYGNTENDSGYTKCGNLKSVKLVGSGPGADIVLTVGDTKDKEVATFSLKYYDYLLNDSTFNGQTLGQMREREEHACLLRFSDILYKAKGDFDFFTEDGESLSVHKTILAARSPVFAAMFETEMKEKKSGQVVIKGCSLEALESFVELLYGKRHAALGKHLGSLIELFDAYQIGDLLEEVGQLKFRELVSVENAADLLFLGAKHGKPEIVELVFQFVKANESTVTATEKWKEWMVKGVNVDFNASWVTAKLKITK